MFKVRITILLLASLLAATQACAVTSDELMSTAIQKGMAKGILTGELGDSIKKQTHSNDPTQLTVEIVPPFKAGCHTFKLTLVQPNVPTRDGKNAGDYLSVTKVEKCEKQPNQIEPEVIDCKVGGVSCMPKK